MMVAKKKSLESRVKQLPLAPTYTDVPTMTPKQAKLLAQKAKEAMDKDAKQVIGLVLAKEYAIVFDTETTGLLQTSSVPLSQQPEIIEFAAIKFDLLTGEEVERLEMLIKPKGPVSETITKITGIKPSDLIDKPSFASVLETLVHFFFGTRVLIAHNLAFDIGMLKVELERLDKLTKFPWPPYQFCTVESSFSLEGHRLKLSQLHEKATGKPHENAHRAMADVEALFTCVKWMHREEVEDFNSFATPGAWEKP